MMTANDIAKLYDLTGRVALVTGAAQGIGLAVAHHLGAQGATIIGVDVLAAELAEATRELTANSIRAVGLVGDIADEATVDALVDRAKREVGLVDILVNNAGIGSHTLPEAVEIAEWQRVLDINLTGSFLMARAVGRQLLAARKSGSIVNISSTAAGMSRGRGIVSFGVSKAGLNQMTKELAIEWAHAGIRVNAIQPCQCSTPGFRRLVEAPGSEGKELLARMLRGIPLGRLAEVEDVASAVHFLASDAAAMITGVILPVDGGNLSLNAAGTLR